MVKPLYILLWGVAAAVGLLVALQDAPDTIYAEHTGVACGPKETPGRAVCLPYADSSFAVRTLQQTRTLTYCFNQRAANYPNFVNQVRNVDANQEEAIGIDWVEIPGTYETNTAALNAGCHVWHSMPATHGCSGCGAWVHYLNSPVIIEYRWQAGYSDWRTTIAHEQTHIYGLHEHYDDANFRSFRNTYGRWAHGLNGDPGTATDAVTVMDSGVGAFLAGDWLTDYDLKHVCQNIDPLARYFPGCGKQPDPCDPCWTGERWLFQDGRSYRPIEGTCGEWFAASGDLAFKECADWGGRYTVVGNGGVWLHRGTPVFTFNEWWSVP